MKMYHSRMTQSFKIVLKNNKQHEYAYCKHFFLFAATLFCNLLP